MSWLCQICGTKNDGVYCTRCGSLKPRPGTKTQRQKQEEDRFGMFEPREQKHQPIRSEYDKYHGHYYDDDDDILEQPKRKEPPKKATSRKAPPKKGVPKKKKGKKKKVFLTLLSLLLIAALIFALIFYLFTKGAFCSLKGTKNADVINIAMFGIDSRDPDSADARADTIMIMSVDNTHKKIKLTSVMRDSYVPMNYKGEKMKQKINAAYSKGGEELCINTLNNVFDLDIKSYATVDFAGMADIVDIMGGIDVNVTEDEMTCSIGSVNAQIECQANEQGLEPEFVETAGKQLLNGQQTVAWARIRHANYYDEQGNGFTDDFGRIARQKYVLKQIYAKAFDVSVFKYPSMLTALKKYVKTPISYNNLMSIACMVKFGKYTLVETRVPMDDYIINNDYRPGNIGSCVYYNLDYAARIVNAFIYDDKLPEDYISENGVDKSYWN